MRTTEPPRFTGLDGLRALAVLAVLTFHADPQALPGGFLGVDLFFAISGYLITRLLLRELRTTGGLDLGRFYLRRAARLLPALLVLLIAVILGSLTLWRDELPTLRGSVLSTLGYAGNWWLIEAHQSYFVATGRPPMTQQLWSLAIEEQFYLLWPVLLVLLTAGLYRIGRRFGRWSGPAYPQRWPLPSRFGRLAMVCLALAGASTAAMAVQAVRHGVPFWADSSRVYFGTDTHAMGLLSGAAAAAWAERGLLRPRRWRVRIGVSDLVGLLALGGLVWCVGTVNEFSPLLFRGGFGLIALLAAAAVAAVARTGSRLGRLLDLPPLRWLAARSYAIYLWHWPVVVVTRPGVDVTWNHWVVLAVRVMVPLGLAEASYRLVERPARRAGASWLEHRASRPLGARGRWSSRRRLIGLTATAAAVAGALALPSTAPAGSLPALQPLAATQPAAPSPLPRPAGSTLAQADTRPRVTGPRVTTTPRPAAAVHRPAPAVKPPPAVSAYGDSVMLGAAPALAADFAGCDLHAVEGRQPYVTLAEVRADHDAGRQQRTVVIHTGNNGLIRAGDLAATLSDLGDRARVVLVTDRVPMDWQQPNNATIERVARGYRNVVVLDWLAASNGRRDWFYPDGLHLRPDGAGHYAALVLAAAR